MYVVSVLDARPSWLYRKGSGNVFDDLRELDADLKQANTVLAARTITALDERGLSVRKVGAPTRLAATDFSRMRSAGGSRYAGLRRCWHRWMANREL